MNKTLSILSISPMILYGLLRCGGMVCTTIHPLSFPVRRATPNGKK